jgi:hypothetical protein
MSASPRHPERPNRPQGKLDREQAAADLDQGIANREQARADRDQEPLDAAQAELHVDVAAEPASAPESASHRARQADLTMAQERADAHQAQLDDNQRGQGLRQDLLDEQQATLEAPADETPADIEATRAQAAADLQEAIRKRSEAALTRAGQARQREAETATRLQATRVRGRPSR